MIIGQRIGSFEISDPLGRGGMGEVWRATDTNLGREVALKLLPDDFADDPDRHARFEREAKVLASLNHPNIATLYGLEHLDGKHVLVMELVEGEGLDERLARGSIPADEAIPVALQIAEALEAAHEAGIVHRDLKPANVRMRPDDTVKVLDFGLAKAWQEDGGTELSISPTLTARHTQAGVILGTAAYMSPEQARGRPVDKRSDIWAFGVVLWEMLTGRRLFEGETVTEVLASVLKEAPDLDALPDQLPPALRRLVGRCLERDPRRRLRDIGEARLVLDDLAAGREPAGAAPRGDATPAAPATGPSRLRPLLPWAVAAAAVAIAVAAWLSRPEPATTSPRLVTSILPPTEGGFAVDLGLALSRDGTRLAVAALDANGNPDLWLIDLTTGEPRKLEGTRGAIFPFWSPDGRHLGYFIDASVKRLEVASGVTDTISDGEYAGGFGGSWSPSGSIVMGVAWADRLAVVSPNGPTNASRAREPHAGSDVLAWPEVLPDGERYLFLVRRYASAEASGEILIASFDDAAPRMLMASNSNALYAEPGYLLWWRDGNLRVQRFDADRLELVGESRPLLPGVRFDPNLGRMGVAVSDTGVLVYQAGVDVGGDELVLVDRHGGDISRVTEPGSYYGPRLSPDGRWAVTDVSDATNKGDVWLYDLQRGAATRVASAAEDETRPRWSPTGDRIIYGRMGDSDRMELWERPVRGRGEARLVAKDAESHLRVTDWAANGLVLIDRMVGDNLDLYVYSPDDDELRPWLATPDPESGASATPDGRFAAYATANDWKPEIWIRSFPDGERAWQVSVGGGFWPAWRSDGGELYYLDHDDWLTAVAVRWVSSTDGLEPELGPPERLFRLDHKSHDDRQYDTRDGQTFLVNRLVRGAPDTPLTVVQGWQPD